MTPTALIGLSPNLKVPKSFNFISQAKPSTFKYPEQWKKDDMATKEKVTTAVLSTTAKVKAREERKQKAEGGAANQDVEMSEQNTNKEEEKAPEEPKLTEEEQKKKDEEEKKQKLEAEPDFLELSNPSRVLKGQEKKIEYAEDNRYHPVLPTRFAGFIILKDTKPDTEEAE